MRTIKDFQFNDEEKELAMSIINRYGTGDHPYCTNMSFPFFTAWYFEEIIVMKYGEITRNLSSKGRDVFDSILNHF